MALYYIVVRDRGTDKLVFKSEPFEELLKAQRGELDVIKKYPIHIYNINIRRENERRNKKI